MKPFKKILSLALCSLLLASCASQGEIGPQGPKGDKGEQGERGEKGEIGATGVSITGVTYVSSSGLVDTYKISFSDETFLTFDVTNGLDGSSGVDGQDGHSPIISIGDNGNWFIDNVDTGKAARGPKGETGSQGISIESVEYTSSSGLVDTYTITYSDLKTSTFTVANGAKGDKGDDGVSIVNVTIGDDGHLYVTLSNSDTPIDAGLLKDIHPHEIVLKEKVVKEPNCTESGYKYLYCETCGEIIKSFYIPALGHSFKDTYTYDHAYHWFESTCGHDVIDGKEEHTFNSDGICTKCNFNMIFNFKKIVGKDEYEITDYVGKGIKNIEIPSTYKNLPVTYLSGELFQYNVDIETVIVPNTIKSIPNNCFYSCQNLNKIILPNNLEQICDNAFAYCEKLSNMSIPESVYTLGVSSFSMSGLSSITIPSKVINISPNCFYNCQYLYSVVISNGVEVISENAFANCLALQTIDIPNSVTNFKEQCISYCPNLEFIHFNGTVEEWSNITKHPNWNLRAGAYSIQCSNGKLGK